MAVTIDATIGGASSNSYATLAQADTFHESNLYSSDWDDATDDQKNRGLVMATRMLDDFFDWLGGAVGATQALLWPRIDVPNHFGVEYGSDELPEELIDATAYVAFRLIQESGDPEAASGAGSAGVQRMKAGPVDFTFWRSISPKAHSIVRSVMPWLSHLGRMRIGTVTTPLGRV